VSLLKAVLSLPTVTVAEGRNLLWLQEGLRKIVDDGEFDVLQNFVVYVTISDWGNT